MNNLLLLTKVNLKNLFSSFVKTNGKKKSFSKSFLIVAAFLYIAIYIYIIANETLPGFVKLGGQELFLVLIFMIVSLYIAFLNIFRIKSTIFDFKDYDLLMSLPVKKNTVLSSKLITLCFYNYIYEFIFMIPCYLAYIKNVPVGPNFHAIYWLSMLFLPIVPIALSSIVGIIVSALMSIFGNKNIGQYISYILILVIAFGISFKSNTLTVQKVVTKLNDLIPTLNNKYPLVNIYYDIIKDLSYKKLLFFILLSIVIFSIVVFVIGILYDKIRTNLLKTKTKDNYQIKEYNPRSQLGSLYKKEMKRLLSSSTYVFNTLLGCLLLIVGLIVLLVIKDDSIEKFLSIPGAINYLKVYGPIVLSLCAGISTTTSCSISLEGKYIWILKSSPIKTFTIYLSKILVNLTFTIPTSIIGATILTIYFKLNLFQSIYMFLTPIAFSILMAVLGLLINLLFPKLDWDNEVRAIKQSFAAFLSILTGMFIPVVLIVIFGNTLRETIPLITGVMFVIDIILTYILYTCGNTLFKKL